MPAKPLVLMLLWLAAATCAPVLAQAAAGEERDAVIERSWLDDPESALTPQAALTRAWTPYTSGLSRGYTASTTWVRLKIDPAAAGPASLASDQRLVLRIMPGHLDEVAVYRPDQSPEPIALIGDAYPERGPQDGLLHYGVVFDNVVQPFEVLLRLRTQSNHSMHVLAQRWDDARAAVATEQTVVFCFLAFTLTVIACAALLWIQQRDAVATLFFAHQLTVMLVALTLLGVVRLYGSPGLASVANRMTSLVIPLTTLVTALFHAALLADLGASRILTRALRALAVPLALAMGLISLGWVRYGLMVSQSAILVLLTLAIAAAWSTQRSRRTSGGFRASHHAYLVTVYVAMAALLMPQSLRALGLLSVSAWSYYGFVVSGLATALLLASLLVVRARENALRREHDDRVLAQVQREAATHRARVAEQSDLMTMLTHELKTPLSVISLALGNSGRQPAMKQRALRAVTSMRDVIDRCMQAARFDDGSDREAMALNIESVALEQVLADAVAGQLQARRVVTHSPGAPHRCLSDRQTLQVILGNLVENALKYSPDESPVTVSIQRAEFEGRPGIAIRVTNRVGVAGRPDEEALFEKYHRGTRATKYSGSGLGLYLSRRLSLRLGAELHLCEGAEDEVCFELWLPC